MFLVGCLLVVCLEGYLVSKGSHGSMPWMHVTIPVSHGVWGEILLERGAGVGRSGCGVAIIMMPDKESRVFYALGKKPFGE